MKHATPQAIHQANGVLSDPPFDLDSVIARHGTQPAAAIPILHEIQDALHWLPREVLRQVCERTQITPAQLQGVSTFYKHFRHKPCGRRLLKICHGTACHVAGSELISDELRRELKLQPGEDTTADGALTIERVACVGCCTIAPMLLIDAVPYGRLNISRALQALRTAQHTPASHLDSDETELWTATHSATTGARAELEVRVGMNSCCKVNGSHAVWRELKRIAASQAGRMRLKPVGCSGVCHRIPLVEVVGAADASARISEGDTALDLVRRALVPKGRLGRWKAALGDALDSLLPPPPPAGIAAHMISLDRDCEAQFVNGQTRLVTRDCGTTDPLDLDEYREGGGYQTLRHCLGQRTPEDIIEQIRRSGLRGRGGGGFPTGEKWAIARRAAGDLKYVVCNGDEGDPGAFMDRMLLEAHPHRVIEGMLIAAYAIGAREGFFYIRHEYALAVRRIQKALEQARAAGLLGDNIFGSGFALDLSVVQGAGAFVCGEETALIQSIEGQRGMPRLRPPYPSEQGIHGRPTNVNNVETLCCVPAILRDGAQPFAALGTSGSKGTKVFALAGQIERGGLIEVPMGTTLWQIVHEIGGGVRGGGRLKAVQLGGPSGGCIPADLAHTPIDYESLSATGAIMGSGGLIVMDETTCMVDMARYFLEFTCKESCGRCTFCRVGTQRMLEILQRLCAGRGKSTDLELLATLAQQVQRTSLCGLGKTAPNPVLTALRYFRAEFEAHVAGRCPAGVCKDLIRHEINERCIGCTICAQECPVDAIASIPYRRHVIDLNVCVQCGVCRGVCPRQAIELKAREPIAPAAREGASERGPLMNESPEFLMLRIDEREIQAAPGETILTAARRAGIEIPTLCHLEGFEPRTSCFLCVVKVEGTGALQPACGLPARAGMIVTTDSAEIREARRTALELLFSDHSGRCVAPCSLSCPANVEIPYFIQAIRAGNIAGAHAIMRRRIPFPAVLGRICPAFCQSLCERRKADECVSIRALHRHAADLDLAAGGAGIPTPAPPTGHHVAVVGAGPAGLSAAYYLRLAGHAVTVFDAAEKPGGLLRYAIPDERLDKHVLDAEIAVIERLGVLLRMNWRLGRDGSLTELRAAYGAVLLACGATIDGLNKENRKVDLAFATGLGLTCGRMGVQAGPRDQATNLRGVFAAGDFATGAGFAVQAVAAGRRASVSIGQHLAGEPISGLEAPFSFWRRDLTPAEESIHYGAAADIPRNHDLGEGLDAAEAHAETERCLQCSCPKEHTCRLRFWGTQLKAKPYRFRGERRELAPDTSHPLIIHEPGKCILCGRCLLLTGQAGEPQGLALKGRGFTTRIGAALGDGIAEGITNTALQCVEACPTAALHLRGPRRLPQ